jgi:hypothetical protein
MNMLFRLFCDPEAKFKDQISERRGNRSTHRVNPNFARRGCSFRPYFSNGIVVSEISRALRVLRVSVQVAVVSRRLSGFATERIESC